MSEYFAGTCYNQRGQQVNSMSLTSSSCTSEVSSKITARYNNSGLLMLYCQQCNGFSEAKTKISSQYAILWFDLTWQQILCTCTAVIIQFWSQHQADLTIPQAMWLHDNCTSLYQWFISTPATHTASGDL